MNKAHSCEGIDGLVRTTVDVVDLNLTTAIQKRRHVEYLPYPDWNFQDESEELVDEASTDNNGEYYSLEEIYLRHHKTFVSGLPVQIIKIEAKKVYNPMREFLYPYLYTITIDHGSISEWTIKKRYKDFVDLHKALLDYVQSYINKSKNDLNKSRVSERIVSEYPSLTEEDQPCFPTENDRIAFISKSSSKERCKMLQNYLNQILKHPKFREHQAVKTFFEVSSLSFVEGLGKSLREGDLLKRSKIDYHAQSIFFRTPFILDKLKSDHGRKWFAIKDSYIVYMKSNFDIVGFPMLIDQAFSINRTFRKTKTHHGIQIGNLQGLMVIKCHKEDEQDQWFNSLLEIKNQSIFAQQHQFQSFAPKRQQQHAQWFINGQSYMEALTKAILSAREEIFITDWWLSPEIMLIRPFEDDSMRLDNLLGKRAEEGIRVYVLIFKDITSSVGLNSRHSKRQLVSKSPIKNNIKVIRHPDHRLLTGTKSSFFYSPHEKTVIIDQRLAFIGGIDLCWGRWDNDNYRLVDLGDENITKLKSPEELSNEHEEVQKAETVLGEKIDMQEHTTKKNIRSTSLDSQINSEEDETKDNANKNTDQKHPNHHQDTRTINDENQNKSKITNKEDHLNNDKKESSIEEKPLEYQSNHHERKWRRLIKRNRKSIDNDSTDEEQNESIDKNEQTIVGVTHVTNDKCRLFRGKDYSNYYKKDFESVEKFDEDYIDRQSTPRMPWHDEVLVVTGEAARDCARHFIQRWNTYKRDKYRFNELYPYLLPKTYDDPALFDISLLRSILPDDRPPICVDAQCVRSASFWSCGIRTVERSVQDAYIDMIDNAQHFIYIENQFFITIAEDLVVENKLADAFYRRIIRADINKEKFRIYIVLPLLPAFANSNALQAILHFIMKSINKGETSLYQRLKQNGVSNPEDYITFYGMRNWDILMGSLVTEIVYVHAKLMIVDDRMCICGSANINDRSLQGTRDSEVCLVVNDVQMIDSCLNKQPEKVGIFSSTWRKTLFRHILGIKNEEEINVDDPCTDEFYEYFRQTAKNNTQIYEEVFNTVPTNQIRQFDDIKPYVQRSKLKDTDPQTAYDKCKQIQGFIVEFPIDFLADDVIMPKWNTSEGIAPAPLWT